ncbi:MAG: ATP-dependent acyl-CoA ligase [Gammaproteobacteria bacterium]|nr:ATP-dependent acyl-CoA ligase [Gammaproteobacteria bacterium]
MNLSDLLSDSASRYGDREFLLFERQPLEPASQDYFRLQLSYREFDTLVNRACHYLAALGLKAGDIFNLHLPNCPAFLILWFAGARLGAVMMPTNVLATADELAYLLDHSKSKLSFTTAQHRPLLEQCRQRLVHLEKVILCDPYSDSPLADSFEDGLSACPESPWSCPAADTDLAAIMYTSGTTSKPKGVMVTHANYLIAGQTVADAIELTENDRHFVVLPLFHGNAQYYSTMSAMQCGASIALMDRFSASRYFDKCIEYGGTVASLFAAPMRMILAQPRNTAHRENRLRIVIFAQNLTTQQLDEWQQRFEAPLAQLWGMTETMGPPLMNPLRAQRRNWTVGKPIGDYQIALVDEAGSPVAVGQEGEITVKGIPGKTIMSGYFNNPQASADAIRDGWLYTGDNAVRDGDGYFRFVDRKKDMIKRSGENVSAGEVENAVLQHPAVFECAVIGLPDEIRDESIVAVVVLHPDQQVIESELIDFCAEKLASFRVPQRVVFEKSLPKTSVGKIQKHLIRAEAVTK